MEFATLILCGQASNMDVNALAHGVTLVLTGVFACIAAFSSLHNGRTLRNGTSGPPTQNGRQEGKPGKKKAAPPADWYKPPDV